MSTKSVGCKKEEFSGDLLNCAVLEAATEIVVLNQPSECSSRALRFSSAVYSAPRSNPIRLISNSLAGVRSKISRIAFNLFGSNR